MHPCQHYLQWNAVPCTNCCRVATLSLGHSSPRCLHCCGKWKKAIQACMTWCRGKLVVQCPQCSCHAFTVSLAVIHSLLRFFLWDPSLRYWLCYISPSVVRGAAETSHQCLVLLDGKCELLPDCQWLSKWFCACKSNSWYLASTHLKIKAFREKNCLVFYQCVGLSVCASHAWCCFLAGVN